LAKSIDFEDFFGTESEINRLAVVGSRLWPQKDYVFHVLEEWLGEYPITTIVSGGQPKGVDGWAVTFAQDRGLELVEHLPAHMHPKEDPRYSPYCPSNYHRRNTDVVHDCDVLLAFCFQNSSGTLSTYEKAKKKLGAHRAILYTGRDLLTL